MNTMERYMMFRHNRTLVIGGSGFIGSYLMKEIRAENMDLKDGWDARWGIKGRYDTIILLACNQENTQQAYNYNYEIFQQLDYYRIRRPNTQLIYLSSAAYYEPTSVYSQTKRLGEVYARRFKNCTILRPSNVYGHGDGHGAPDRFMRGEHIINGDGEQIRDLVAVEDVVDIIKWYIGLSGLRIANVSSGTGVTVNQMFKMFGAGTPIYDKKADVGVKESILEPGLVYYD